MPTYEYACRDCNQHLEVVQSFTDDPLTACGACGGRLRKVFSAAGIIFKGSGYYVNDTRAAKAGKNGDSAKKSEAPSASDSKDSSKTPSESSTSTSEAKSA